MVEQIFELEDVLKNQICSDKRFTRTFNRERNWFTRFVYTSAVGKMIICKLNWIWYRFWLKNDNVDCVQWVCLRNFENDVFCTSTNDRNQQIEIVTPLVNK